MIALQNTIAAEIGRLQSRESARAVRGFATWHHLRRLRRQLGDEHLRVQQVEVVRRDVRAAVDLLDWLHARHVSLAECSHSDIVDWLSTGPRSRYRARTFLLWSAKNGHSPKGLKIPVLPNYSVPEHIADDERWAIVRRLLHDDSVNTVDRAAGLLACCWVNHYRG